MKKKLLIILCAIIGFTACTKEDLGSRADQSKGEMTRVTVGLDNLAKTRSAYADPDLSDMRVVLIVSHNDKVVYTETRNGINFGSPQAFDVRLVSDQEYTVSCWADFGSDYYTVEAAESSMPKVEMVYPYVASNNKRDAYFAGKEVTFDSEGVKARTVDLKLTRPFGLVKINTTDYNAPTVKAGGFRPSSYAMSVSVPTTMSLLNGVVGESKSISLSGAVSSTYGVDADSKELSFDYLFATSDRKLIDFTVDYTAANGVVSYKYTSIPIQRNYRTNITGNILTKVGGVVVTVDNVWTGDESVSTNETATTDFERELLKAKTDSKTDFTFRMSEAVKAVGSETSRTFSVPDDVTGDVVKTLEIDFSAGIQIPINIADKTPDAVHNNYEGTVNVVVPQANAALITFNLPKAHVIVKGTDGTVIREINATTGSTTLVVEAGVTVDNLTVNGGNVDVYGTVNNIERTVGNADAKTVVRIFPGAVVTNRGTDTKIEYIEIGDIVNLTTNANYPNIASALSAAKSGETVELSAKTFNLGTTGITVPAGVTLKGVEGSVITLSALGQASAWAVSVSGGTLDGVEVRYASDRKPEDVWNNENPGGVLLMANSTIKNSKVVNFRNGVYANNVTGVVIDNNTITTNRTGIQFANTVEATVTGNTISNNVTMGVLVQYLTTKDNRVPTFTGNTFSGNWYSDFENRFPATQSPYVIDLNGNTFNGGTKTLLYGTSGEFGSATQGVKPASQMANIVTAVPTNITLTDAVVVNKVMLVRSGNIVGFNYASIAEAMDASTAGDVIKLGQETFGTATNFTEYAGQAITIKAGVALEGSGAATVVKVQLKPLSNVTIKNLTLQQVKGSTDWGDNQGLIYAPVYYTSSTLTGLVIDGVTFNTDSRAAESKKGATAMYMSKDFVVKNCVFNNFWKGIFTGTGDQMTVTNNTFTNINPISFTAQYNGNVVITGNTFARNSNSDVQLCDISPATDSELVFNTNIMGISGVKSVSDNFKAFVADFRANNTWSGSQSANKPIYIRNSQGAYKSSSAL